MEKKWLIASYKINESKRLEINLLNQKFEYYLPKITTKKINSKSNEEVMFPGYIFVYTNLESYLALKYTIGITNIIKFGDNVAYMSNEDIKAMKMVEQASKLNPVVSQIQIGQDALISDGFFKGSIVKICSLSSKERVGIFLTFLGTKRRISIPIKDLTF